MKPAKLFRIIALVSVTAFISWIGYRHQVLGGGPSGAPSVDALCPLGGLESLYSYLKDGTWLRRIAPSALVLFISVTVMTLLLGRAFCGWLCPLGALSELPGRIVRKMGLKQIEFPQSIDKYLRFLKYILLIIILYFTWRSGNLVFRNYDPWMAWMHITAGFEGAVAATVILFVILIAALFVSRFWCRYLCPLGAALSLFSFAAPVKIRRDASSCINCKKCDKVCPVAIKPSQRTTPDILECIACGECTAECPKKNTLNFKLPAFFKNGSKVPALAVGVLAVVILLGGYGASMSAGFWRTHASSGATSAKGADKIFGWMSINQVSEAVGIPAEEIIRITGLPETTPLDVSIRTIEGINDEAFRERIRKYLSHHKK